MGERVHITWAYILYFGFTEPLLFAGPIFLSQNTIKAPYYGSVRFCRVFPGDVFALISVVFSVFLRKGFLSFSLVVCCRIEEGVQQRFVCATAVVFVLEPVALRSTN